MWKITVANDVSCANVTEAAMLALALENGCTYNSGDRTFSCSSQDRCIRIYSMLVAMDASIMKVFYAAT